VRIEALILEQLQARVGRKKRNPSIQPVLRLSSILELLQRDRSAPKHKNELESIPSSNEGTGDRPETRPVGTGG